MFGAADGDSALDHLDHLDLIQEGASQGTRGVHIIWTKYDQPTEDFCQ